MHQIMRCGFSQPTFSHAEPISPTQQVGQTKLAHTTSPSIHATVGHNAPLLGLGSTQTTTAQQSCTQPIAAHSPTTPPLQRQLKYPESSPVAASDTLHSTVQQTNEAQQAHKYTPPPMRGMQPVIPTRPLPPSPQMRTRSHHGIFKPNPKYGLTIQPIGPPLRRSPLPKNHK